MSADPLHIVEALVTTVRNLTLDDNYKAVASVFDEIPLLKGQVKSKDTELDRLRREITDLKTAHSNRLGDELALYCTQHSKLEEEKTKLSGEISTLNGKIQQSGATIAELNRTQEVLREQLGQVEKSLDKEKETVSTANTEITELQQSLKAKDAEIDKLKESLHNEKAQASKTKSQLHDLQKENTSLQQDLRSQTTRLNEVEGFAMKLGDQDEAIWVNQLNEIWESARLLVESYFKHDLPENSLESLVKNLRDSQLLDRPIPLPRSNSPAAKRMRIAAILAILARWISLAIFQPTYILDEDEEIRILLIRLAVANSKKESFCRGLLLSIDPEKQTKNASKRVEQVIREVAWYVRDSLSVVQYESFRPGLELVVQRACDFWRTMQCAREKFEPYFELNDYTDIEWQPLKFEGGEQSLTRASDVDEKLLVIFPRIYIIEDDEPDPITNGVVLMKSQSTAAAEEENLERRKSSSPTVGKAAPKLRSNKTRNKSISLNGGNDFLSPKTPSGAH